jgi:hypothetical protein
MDTILNLLITNSIVGITVAVVFSIVPILYVVAFFQGREVTFWPPKIGAKPSTVSIEASKNIQNENNSIVFLGGYSRKVINKS